MRAVAGEMGAVDKAALHEFLKNRRLIYEAYSDTTCLVELDEEPPHPLNQEALDIALETAILLKAKPVDELQVMRKTVIDGSNTTGFQRTILVAMDGRIETSEGSIGIPTICLEEDAARKIEEKGDSITYRLDRLGIPLVEIATTPDIKNPRHARETAEKIGMLLRATGKVKRGLGTIRQDLNVSIREGNRIEVKGVQNLNDIPKIIENEVRRQTALIEIKKELEKRGVRKQDLKTEFIDVSAVIALQGREWMKAKLNSGEKAFAVRLKGFEGLLGKELMPDYRFGTELARIAKSAYNLGGITHSDEKLEHELKKKLDETLHTAYVCAIAQEEIAKKTLETIVERCKTAMDGVPHETRTAVGELTEYMRPLPGSDRMYPETDEPLIEIENKKIESIGKNLPELFEQKEKRYEKMGLNAELAAQMSKSTLAGKFEQYSAEYEKLKPSVIASVLLMAPKEAKKRFNANTEVLTDEHTEEILKLLEEGAITKESVVEVMVEASKNPSKSITETVKEKNLGKMDDKELDSTIEKALKEAKLEGPREQQLNLLLGKAMGLCKGRAEASRVREKLAARLG